MASSVIFIPQWIFVQYEFLLFNVLTGKSAMFGTHPWHWYVWGVYASIVHCVVSGISVKEFPQYCSLCFLLSSLVGSVSLITKLYILLVSITL